MGKELLNLDTAPKKIKNIQFGLLKPSEIQELSEVQLSNRELYSIQERIPVPHGVLDRRLGTSDKTSVCETCGGKLSDCTGHFGNLDLCLPVFHIGFFKAILQILQDICKSCSSILLEEEERQQCLQRVRNPRLDSLQKLSLLKTIHERCRKTSVCPKCLHINGSVKKVGVLKIVHDRYKGAKKHQGEGDLFREHFKNAIAETPDIKVHLPKAADDLNPLVVMELFKNLKNQDCELLGIDIEFGHPLDFLWTEIPVPPACIRPSVVSSLENGSNEDDLTIKITEIIYTNMIIKDAMQKGSPVHMLMEDWDFLQLQCAMYINSELPGVAAALQTQGKPIRGLCQRLKGKMGRFRGNLSGKRVDFSSRTVISPDPNLPIDHIAVPVYVAKKLTFPEKVTSFNIDRLRLAITNGPDVHPGANFLIQKSAIEAGKNTRSTTTTTPPLKRYLKFGDRKKIARDLRVGDCVERHLRDGDIVLFNRQPSLHKLSIMSHHVVVRPWRTFRLNECACTPYNADFDGDEMNMHLPQTEEARAEAMQLMGIKHNLVTPRNGQPLIAAIQDFITASYLMSRRDVFMDCGAFCQACVFMDDGCSHVDLCPPAIMHPVALWTGKQVMGKMMQPHPNILVNTELKTRTLTKGYTIMCPNDGYLIVRNSEVMCGSIDKSGVGGDSKQSIFYVLMRDFGTDIAIACMSRLAKLCARWLGNRGFSIGINDVTPGAHLSREKQRLVDAGYAECDALIVDFESGSLESQPGCSVEQTLEAKLSGVLSKIRDDVGQTCLQELSRHNAPLIMQWCGSKGSKINVSQMVACVGQQIISGSRIPDGFDDRSLPHFPKHSKTPAAKGFVSNSFYSGLSPTEFFFHAVSGREGLVDTAVKTAETGYMQRRLMKALEDLSVQYDGSVRNSRGDIVQFVYGDDGLDPTMMEGEGEPVNFARNLLHAQSITAFTSSAPEKDELMDIDVGSGADDYVEMARGFVQGNPKLHADFVGKLLEFIKEAISVPMARIAAQYAHLPNAQQHAQRIMNISRQTLDHFLAICLQKYEDAVMEPGTAVGALGAQSIGEPGTQMTLKTFHFAGVASMNVTLGVPRIKEIINASKVISTPIITAALVNSKSVPSARIVKGRIEKTLLGDIAEHIELVFDQEKSFILIKLDLHAIQQLQLEIDIYSVQRSLVRAPKLKISDQSTEILFPHTLHIHINNNNNNNMKSSKSADPGGDEDGEKGNVYSAANNPLFTLQSLKRKLSQVVISGCPTVNRAVINDVHGNATKYNLLVEGYGLAEVMGTEGVIGHQTTSNHIMEVERVLGIEAARTAIASEIEYTMSKHGMTIDTRHVQLLSDIMTNRGEVLGITRFGIAKMKDSVLMLASFEKTTDHLFDAARYSKRDDIDGVSECIIMGTPMPVGTGLFKLVQKIGHGNSADFKMKQLIFDNPKYHRALSSTA